MHIMIGYECGPSVIGAAKDQISVSSIKIFSTEGLMPNSSMLYICSLGERVEIK